jgi:hypothetical protein
MKKAQWILIQYGRVVFDQPKYEKNCSETNWGI